MNPNAEVSYVFESLRTGRQADKDKALKAFDDSTKPLTTVVSTP